jgi:hypothetical protein
VTPTPLIVLAGQGRVISRYVTIRVLTRIIYRGGGKREEAVRCPRQLTDFPENILTIWVTNPTWITAIWLTSLCCKCGLSSGDDTEFKICLLVLANAIPWLVIS